ncbi:MAG: amidohydrolase family protein, partial [Gammaproteobacteria bacterium]|nr:amidohydrolase family protein [Gammaproteobacteria bacterium]
MKLVHRILARISIVVLLGAVSNSWAAGQIKAIVGATAVDLANGHSIPNSVLLIDGDRIMAIGPAGAVSVPQGADIIHADGKWLLPGLM